MRCSVRRCAHAPALVQKGCPPGFYPPGCAPRGRRSPVQNLVRPRSLPAPCSLACVSYRQEKLKMRHQTKARNHQPPGSRTELTKYLHSETIACPGVGHGAACYLLIKTFLTDSMCLSFRREKTCPEVTPLSPQNIGHLRGMCSFLNQVPSRGTAPPPLGQRGDSWGAGVNIP